MADPKVRIRTYRPGLGDCHLLTFTSGSKKSHILIDCGVFIGTKGEKSKLVAIADHVLAETGSKANALVVTHEHWDHVAGFFRAEEQFEQLNANEVWLAWTEDPEQEIAQENDHVNAAMASTIAMAAQRLAKSPSEVDRRFGIAAANILGFGGTESTSILAAKFSKQSDAAMDFVTAKKKDSQPFLEPGDTFTRSWLPGVRVYVLGPPMDLAELRNMSGTKEENFESKHGAAMGWMSAVMLGAGKGDFSPEALQEAERLRPFDPELAWPESKKAELEERMPALYEAYRAESWRTIDNDWLQSAASLALQLDNAINNTSLVLAFELVESGKVLLFVGDAQVGNWKSWLDLEFEFTEDGEDRIVSARDLLKRVVFYKVGHHGSGNATLPAGLEAMTSSQLVAVIPTDEQFAHDKFGWEMPAPRLATALRKKTKGRIIRADPGKKPIPASKPAALSKAAWDRFRGAISEDPLFIDFEM